MSLFIRLTITGLIVFSIRPVLAQSDPEAIRAAVESANWQSTLTQLVRLRETDPRLFQAGSYDYLLARVSEKLGDVPTATVNYQSVVDRNASLAPYALWHLAHIARSSGDLVHERECLRRLTSLAPQSLLFDAAVLRLGESYFESGDYSSTVNSLAPALTSRNVPLAREALTITGQAFVHDKKFAEARPIFSRLIMSMPDASKPDDYALTAVRELDVLEKPPGDTNTAPLAEAEHLLRASIYQFNRDFSAARLHYQAVVALNPQSGTTPNALYQIGRGLYSEGKYDEAIKVFGRVGQEFSQSTSARDALAFLASSYMRMKQPDAAIANYKLLIEKFPDAPNPERPYLNIIDALHEAGRESEALEWVQQTRTRFRNELAGALALFAQLRIHLAQGQWPSSIADADELLKYPDLGGTKVAGGTTPSEVRFLRAYALESSGRIDEAIPAYVAIDDGRSEYYGARATQRLQALAVKETSRAKVAGRLASLVNSCKTAAQKGDSNELRLGLQSALRLSTDPKQHNELLQQLRTAYANLPAYKINTFRLLNASELTGGQNPTSLASQLASFGLYDEAIPELNTLRSSAPSNLISPDDSYSIAVYSLRGGLANRAVRFGEQIWRTVPADYVLEAAPRDLAELLYPAPYRVSLLNHAVKLGVDPRFVLSIARQESRYQADAKSVAAARGMMQFIAATAGEIAMQLKLSNFVQDDLYDADTAILFGSQYLANLFRQFPAQPDAVAAAYNGGADNMSRWKARSRSSEPERYVAEIGFAQTKDYVYRVMTNFWNYQQLYDDRFEPLVTNSK